MIIYGILCFILISLLVIHLYIEYLIENKPVIDLRAGREIDYKTLHYYYNLDKFRIYLTLAEGITLLLIVIYDFME